MTVGPCIWDVDLTCCEDWGTYSAAITGAAFDYATTVMWAATGRRFGLCERVVRPCGNEADNSGVYGYWWSDGVWLPYVLNGTWRNCWCGSVSPGCSSCRPECQVFLPGPVASVTSITVDGVVVDPTSYRIDNGSWLVRTKDASEDNCWPVSQDFDLNSGVGTFIVTLNQGLEIPVALKRAAGELACEYAKACSGAACRLPGRVSSLSRQGVSISMVGVEQFLEHGLTGISTIDQIIRVYNPYGLTSAMRVFSLDTPTMRETTWP